MSAADSWYDVYETLMSDHPLSSDELTEIYRAQGYVHYQTVEPNKEKNPELRMTYYHYFYSPALWARKG